MAIVNENGTVTAISKGTATITATVSGTTLMDTYVVTVEQAMHVILAVPQSVAKNQTFSVIIGVKTPDQILIGIYT